MSIDDVTHITYDGTISRDDEEAMLDAEQALALPLDVIWGMGHWTFGVGAEPGTDESQSHRQQEAADGREQFRRDEDGRDELQQMKRLQELRKEEELDSTEGGKTRSDC